VTYQCTMSNWRQRSAQSVARPRDPWRREVFIHQTYTQFDDVIERLRHRKLLQTVQPSNSSPSFPRTV